MSLIFFKEETVLHYVVRGAWKLPALHLLLERKQNPHIHALSTNRPAVVSMHGDICMGPSGSLLFVWILG